MTATATEKVAKTIVTTILRSDGTAVIKPTKPTLGKLVSAKQVCDALEHVTALGHTAKAASEALASLIEECS